MRCSDCWIAEISVKMSGASGTSGSSGKAKASHPTYASMIQQGLTALKVSYSSNRLLRAFIKLWASAVCLLCFKLLINVVG